jgi:hypothetical protein
VRKIALPSRVPVFRFTIVNPTCRPRSGGSRPLVEVVHAGGGRSPACRLITSDQVDQSRTLRGPVKAAIP